MVIQMYERYHDTVEMLLQFYCATFPPQGLRQAELIFMALFCLLSEYNVATTLLLKLFFPKCTPPWRLVFVLCSRD
jgi:hypothetical protein